MKWHCPFNGCGYVVEKNSYGNRKDRSALGMARSNHLRKHKVFTSLISNEIKRRNWSEQDRIIVISTRGRQE